MRVTGIRQTNASKLSLIRPKIKYIHLAFGKPLNAFCGLGHMENIRVHSQNVGISVGSVGWKYFDVMDFK